jgi:nucleotide-binding universal stress UspA family protein
MDLNDPGDTALRAAVALASTSADALAVVYVHVGPPFLEKSCPDLNRQVATTSGRPSETVRERMRSVSARQAEVFVEEGVESEAILRRARSWDADVVVVGISGRSGLSSHAFGGVAERVLHQAHCTVLVARPQAASGWVLAATDLADPAFPALKTAAAVARRRGAKLEVVRALGFIEVEARYLLAPSAPPFLRKGSTRSLRTNSPSALPACRSTLRTRCSIAPPPPPSLRGRWPSTRSSSSSGRETA